MSEEVYLVSQGEYSSYMVYAVAATEEIAKLAGTDEVAKVPLFRTREDVERVKVKAISSDWNPKNGWDRDYHDTHEGFRSSAPEAMTRVRVIPPNHAGPPFWHVGRVGLQVRGTDAQRVGKIYSQMKAQIVSLYDQGGWDALKAMWPLEENWP